MLIRTQNEIISLMPTARWDRPEQLYGYLEEEERVALEPLLGTTLFKWVCEEYERLIDLHVDITATTIKPTGKAKTDPGLPYSDVTERLDAIQAQTMPMVPCCAPMLADEEQLSPEDMAAVQLIRICQQIEFYKMLAHKAGLLTVSFNEGGGMNVVSADGYDGADEKAKDRVVRDAFMSAGRAIDSLLLFLEADAKSDKLFTEKWQDADAFYLHKDLLFQTARVMQEFLGTKIDRMTYVDLIHDIRFCQNTYLKPRIGAELLKAVVNFANNGPAVGTAPATALAGSPGGEDPVPSESVPFGLPDGVGEELLSLLRTALAFYVEARRDEVNGKKLARNSSQLDAQQALAAAADYIADNLDTLGSAAESSPIYKKVKEAEQAAEAERRKAEDADGRRRCHHDTRRNSMMFTAFPRANSWRTEKK